jgi:glycosyl hydrolase family 2
MSTPMRIRFVAVSATLLSVACLPALAGEYVWLEGEEGQATVGVSVSGWGRTHFLSEQQWLHLSIDAGKVAEQLPDEGATISYRFRLPKEGEYEIWNRIGFEFVRSAFEWRIDDGAWEEISPDELTTDLMDLAQWCEVAWLKMGARKLGAGEHTLEIRLSRRKDESGKLLRVLYASDAICIHEGPFRPNSKYKPNETGADDTDREAAQVVFQLPETPLGKRASVSLKGLWEVTRHDEQTPGEVAEPIRELPDRPVWRAIPVPSDKNKVREDLIFAHRLWYRTRVQVPASMEGRSFYVDFPCNNMNTTVYVNGVPCGFEKNMMCRFQIDVTKGIRPGEVNEIWVGIRDAWYGRSADPQRPMKLRRTFNIPIDKFHEGFMSMDYPVWNCAQSGILATPTFVAAGRAYASDVFVRPSVAHKRLDADVTLTNNTQRAVDGEIRWEAVNDATGEVEHTFAPKGFRLDAGAEEVVELSGDWADPKLWWPDSPNLYRLRTIVTADGAAIDTRETLFGFREWRIDGIKFTLNGVVWHLWADLVGTGATPEQWLEAYRRTDQRMMRLTTAGQGNTTCRWLGLEPEEALEFMDRNGVVVRRNTTLDGEVIGYAFSENDEATIKKQGGSKLKLALMKNWRDQCVAQVKGERNHPSIQIWTIENEFAYINLINLLGNSPMMDEYEEEIQKTSDAVMAADPTRSVMIDGGGALKNNTLPVTGDHYVASLDGRYPDLAYEPHVTGGGRGRWEWDMKRPRFIGEDFFATGINPADYAQWGGEVAFQGKAATRDSVAICYRMLQEGYRWGGYMAAWHFWLGGDGGNAQWGANPPRAALVRQYDWSFLSGSKVSRTFGVFNDTQYSTPITFTRTLTVGGEQVFARTTEHRVAPGTSEKFDEQLPMPVVARRAEGVLLLVLTVDGKEVFRDSKSVSVLPSPALGGVAPEQVGVYDPSGKTKAFLSGAGVSFVELNSLENLPAGAKVLIVGPDALDERSSTSTTLAAYASTGRTVIVLDQRHPLKYQALPAEIETTTDSGRTAFIEDSSHPAFKGLMDKDFFTWAGDHVVYRNAYMKPSRGGKSLLQVGSRLSRSALVEVPVGKGLVYLCQLAIGEKIAVSPAAQGLLLNLVEYGTVYKQEFAQVVAVVRDEQLAKALDAIGLRYETSKDPVAALTHGAAKVAVISATTENVKLLATHMDRVRAFWQRGGTIVFHGLTPEGLDDYNTIVGVDHLIRPFRRERVTFPAVRNPLTAGLTTGDIVMLSGERIFGWTRDEYVSSDVFTHVVDYDEIAPFCTSSFFAYDNITNGFLGSDAWKLIIDFPHPADGTPFEIPLELPREETIVELTHKASMNYNATTRIALAFDDGSRVEFPMEPNGDPQTFQIDPPRKAERVTLQLLEWLSDPAKASNVGIDNIWLKVHRSEEFRKTVRPMLNVGGMMQYVKGSGGVILCNLKLQEEEPVPINKLKKRTILATVLRNLKAPFAGGRTVIAGADLAYAPLDIHEKATTYKDERGWFGDRNRTFAGLPEGRHVFAGVPYEIYEMPTSPVPQVLMLGGNRVPRDLPEEIRGIPVGVKADALFFLHTARLDRRMNDRDRREKKRFVMFQYVVHYADGQSVEVPIVSEIDIHHYRQQEPKALPGAQLAWTRPYGDEKESASAWAKQWNNPRPDVVIESVDMVYVDRARGVPVLLAITAATGE